MGGGGGVCMAELKYEHTKTLGALFFEERKICESEVSKC